MMRNGKKYTIQRSVSDRRFSPSDIERIESLLATFIAKAIIGGRITGKEPEVEGNKMNASEDEALLPEDTAELVTHH